MKQVLKTTINLAIMLVMAQIFSCSGDSDDTPPAISSSSVKTSNVSSSGGESSSSGGESSSSGGESSSSSEISSSSHVHVGEWVITTPATCAAAGKKTRTCADDGTVEEEVIPKIDYDATEEFCQSVTNVVKDLCGGQEYEATKFCQGSTIKALCGTQTYTASQFCYNSSKVGDFCGARTNTYNPDIYQCKPSINANGIYLKTPVSYQGESYEAVLIGTQTWLARNLNYAANGSKCGDNASLSDDNTATCDTYGRLYDWATAMAACPDDWHLPSQAEWDALNTFIESDKDCSKCDAKHLKAPSGWEENGNGLDSYGFTALPGGEGYPDDNFLFYSVGDLGFWWSTSVGNNDLAYHRSMYYYEDAFWEDWFKSSLYSVRCLQD